MSITKNRQRVSHALWEIMQFLAAEFFGEHASGKDLIFLRFVLMEGRGASIMEVVR